MKKYLCIVLLTCIYVQAENNPFELKKNLEKIDKDQDILLSALKEIRENKEVLDAKEVSKNLEKKKRIEQKQQSHKYDVDNKTKVMAQVKKEKERVQKIKEAQARIETQRKQAIVAKKVARKREQERLKVESYKKKRISKKKLEIKEIAVQPQSNNMTANIDIMRERKTLKKEADKAYLQAVLEMDKED